MQHERKRVLLGGIVSLMIAMGIGRFAYTPILPLMQSDLEFSDTVAGLLASSNYAGYLLGAIGTSFISFRSSRVGYLRLSLCISIMTTIAMGVTNEFYLFHLFRFISGVASAYIFVLASSIVLDYLAKRGQTKQSGILYAGVGLGILFSTLFIPKLYEKYDWNGTWIGLGVISLFLLMIPLICLRERKEEIEVVPIVNTDTNQKLPHKRWFPIFAIAYGLEGLGYIITGTFIVAIAKITVSFSGDATTIWAIAGLSAIPSCILWAEIANRIGYMKTLSAIYALQAIGIILPAIQAEPVMFYMSAILFGATFMGITTITATVARQMFPKNISKILGFLTVIYATGQMIGPAIGGWLADQTLSYSLTLYFAGGMVGLGALLIATGMKYDHKKRGA